MGAVGIHKKGDNAALQPAAQPAVEVEPLAGHLGSGLGVQDPQIGADIPVRQRLVIKVGRLAPAAQLHVFGVVAADGYRLVGNVGDCVDDVILLRLQLGKLRVLLLDLLGKFLHLRHNGGDVLALLFVLRDQLGDTVLLGLHVIHRRVDGAPLDVDLQDLVDLAVHILVAVFHGGFYPLGVLSNYFDIQHRVFPSFLCFYRFGFRRFFLFILPQAASPRPAGQRSSGSL